MKLCYCGRSSAIVGETFGVDSFLPLDVSGVVPAHHRHSWCDGVTIGGGFGGAAFFPNGTCVWFQFRITLAQASELWHWVGSDMQKHIAAWELLAQFALTFCIESRLPRGRGLIACYPWHRLCLLCLHPTSLSWGASTFFRKWPTSLVTWISLQTRWVDSSSPFLNHSQWTISVMCGGRSCLQKWPAQFGIDIKSVLQQSADCGFPQSIFLLGSYGLRLVDFRFHFGAYLTPHLIQPVCYPAIPGMYICVVNSWSGGSQFDPVGLYSVGPAGTFLVVQSLGSTCTTLKNLGTPAAAARVSRALMCT